MCQIVVSRLIAANCRGHSPLQNRHFLIFLLQKLKIYAVLKFIVEFISAVGFYETQ